MKSIRTFLLAAVAALLCQFALAEELVIATGDSKAGSAYSRMFREMMKACPNPEIKERESVKGSVENLDLLTDNQVQGIFVQGDFLAYWNKQSPQRVKDLRTLATLHNEELHYIARADVKKEGGFMGFGGKDVVYNTISDLKGRPVGAAGGSAISGRVVSGSAGVDYNVVEYPNNTDLVKDLREKKIDAILITGGAQHPLVAGLPAEFKLLSVPQDVQDKLAKIYKPVELNYSNIGAVGVKSLATPALFVVYNFDDDDRVKQLMALRKCFIEQAPKIGNRSGMFAKWRQVNVADKGPWTYYEPAAAK